MALDKHLKVVGGQLIYDRPYYCGLCRAFLPSAGRRRTLIEHWECKIDKQGREVWKKRYIRLCTTKDSAVGCTEMGFSDLFKREREQWRNRRLVGQVKVA